MTQYEKDIAAGLVIPEIEQETSDLSLNEILKYHVDNAELIRESMLIAAQILDVLHKKGLTKSELACALGETPQAVNKYFSGKWHFSLPLKHKIEKALDVKLGEFFVEHKT